MFASYFMGFPDSYVGKESTCSAGDPSSIPGSGRSPGERIGYLLQYSWASPVAQMEKNLAAVQETWVQSLVWEDPLEDGMATHSSILAWKIPRERGVWRATVHGVAESDMTEWLNTAHTSQNSCSVSLKIFLRTDWLGLRPIIFHLECHANIPCGFSVKLETCSPSNCQHPAECLAHS